MTEKQRARSASIGRTQSELLSQNSHTQVATSQLREEHEALVLDHALDVEHESESAAHSWFIEQQIAEIERVRS
jgi:hypothetical protein